MGRRRTRARVAADDDDGSVVEVGSDLGQESDDQLDEVVDVV